VNTEIFENQGFGVFWWWQQSEFVLYFERLLEKFDNHFWSLKTTWKTLGSAPCATHKQLLVGGARGPLWRGARLEEIGQIGLKSALVLTVDGLFKKL